MVGLNNQPKEADSHVEENPEGGVYLASLVTQIVGAVVKLSGFFTAASFECAMV